MLLADADPPGPPAAAPAAGTDRETLPVAKRGGRVERHALAHGRVGASRQPPGHDHAVEAVDHR